MLTFVVWSVAVALAAGLIIKVITDRKFYDSLTITWHEFAVGAVVLSLVVIPAVTLVGWNMAKENLLTYHEYWNGWELEAQAILIPCTRDGSCGHTYRCDPYIVMVPYTCNCRSVSCGKNCTTQSCSTCFRPETRYHQCPYVDQETTYKVVTSLGDYVIGANRFPVDPQAHRWRSWETIPQSIIDYAGVGEPPFWTAANSRIASGQPGPVTVRKDYKNYVLASDTTILKQYSDAVAAYQAANLLPPVQREIHNFYWADKVHFVNVPVEDPSAWQMALNYLNAGLGTELQGDLHLVIVSDTQINNPDEYILALKAFWMNSKVFDRDAISKNSVIVVLGTNNRSVSWARATTGMPLGNELMLVRLQDGLKGVQFTPQAVIGNVTGQFYQKEKNGETKRAVKSVHGSGVLENVLWGLQDPGTLFERVCMTCTDGKESGGFLYLASQIQPTEGQKQIIFLIDFLLNLVVWIVFAFYGPARSTRASYYN